MVQKLCLYHGRCLDGFTAAYAVWHALRDTCEFVPIQHDWQPIDVDGRHVIMVDITLNDGAAMDELLSETASLTLLDHHESARDMFEFLKPRPQDHVEFDMYRSGAMMAWEHFNPLWGAPKLIHFVQDRDLWIREMPDSDVAAHALRMLPQDFETWNRLAHDPDYLDAVVNEARPIARWYRERIEELKRTSYLQTIGGSRVPVVNCPSIFASDVAGELAVGALFAATWCEVDGRRFYSLRAGKDSPINVRRVAEMYGGGGHAKAAGFSLAPGQNL
jgi:oligoribonuclease NrnB/cAMP/cGMP phosphodiesterase (DHH superfamily)